MHYCAWGEESAPPLILLHGLRDHGRAWDRIAEALAGSWRVIVPDLRGHGNSAWASDGTYAMSGFVFDLAELIDRRGFERVSIVGHSLGGNIALRFAASFPEKLDRLVVIEGIGSAPDVAAKMDEKPVSARMREWVLARREGLNRTPRRLASFDEAVKRMQKGNSRLLPAMAEHLTRHAVTIEKDGSCAWKFDPALRTMVPEDFIQAQKLAMISDVTAPTLLIYGDDSWASNPRNDGRMTHFRDVRLETFPDAGHWVHHDAPDEFLRTVGEFLSAIG